MNNELLRKLNEELPSNDKIDLEALSGLESKDNLPLIESPKSLLNEDQTTGLNTILNWLYTYKKSRNENAFFSLRGSAGTGKTTLIGQLVKEIDRNKYSSGRICICAPTHKAKKVILSKTKWPNGETLQSILGMKLDVNIEDFDPNKPEFSQSGQRKIQDYDLLIIDESSMINTKLYELLIDCAKGCMVLFVGDHVQLNPVKEFNVSLALTSPVNSYTITTPARQKVGNPLLDLLNLLREDIENGTDKYYEHLKEFPADVNSNGEGYQVCTDRKKFADYMILVFNSEDFKQDKDYVRYIAWTNDAITKTNRWIRSSIYGFKDSTVEKGEILLSYRTVVEKEEAIIVNSDDYIVEDVKPYLVSDYSYPIQALAVTLKCIDTGLKANLFIVEREDQNYSNYTSVYDEHLTEAKAKRAWSKVFYPFKNHLLITDTVKYKNAYLTEEKIIKDIDYGYGITAHKSQGSTYNTVFVNYNDIAQIVTFSKPQERMEAETMKKRLLYVALSRASKKAYLIM